MRHLTALFTTLILAASTNAQSIFHFTDSLMLSDQVPELGFAVLAPDSLLELKTLGYHRVDLKNESTKARNSDYFHIGSNTKAITGFVAAFLVEDHKIKWNTKFFDLFPEWKQASNAAYAEVTLADLLSHRGRIEPYTSGLEYQELPEFKGSKAEQRKQFAKYVLREKPVKADGIPSHYSNAGYSIAALMLEKVTGNSWEQLVKETMLTKVKARVEFGFPNRIDTLQPYGHWMENDTLKAVGPEADYDLALEEPAGDISMMLPDYARFIQLNLQGLCGNDNVLSSPTYEYLHFGIKGYSIGWQNQEKDGEKLSRHSGSAGTFFCHALIDVNKKRAYVILMNSATPKAQEGTFELLKKLRAVYDPAKSTAR